MGNMHNHLTLEDRMAIENGIRNRKSFAAIARAIGKDRSTISRELQRNRKKYKGTIPDSKMPCRHTAQTCPVSHACGNCIKKNCQSHC